MKNLERLKGYRIEQATLIKIPKREKKEYTFKEEKGKNVLWSLKDIPIKRNHPYILVTPSFRRGYYGVCEDLVDALLSCDFNIFISQFLGDEEIVRLLEKEFLKGIVLSGGNDITPALYGGDEKLAHKPDLRRDNFEISLYRKSVEKKLPVLAICRGLQVVNVAHGGSLKSGLRAHKRDSGINNHLLRIKDNSLFKKISKVGFLRVGTSHHQAIDRLGKDVISVAEVEDGVIEMIEVKNYPLIATQFHPERSQDGDAVFNAFRILVQKR